MTDVLTPSPRKTLGITKRFYIDYLIEFLKKLLISENFFTIITLNSLFR